MIHIYKSTKPTQVNSYFNIKGERVYYVFNDEEYFLTGEFRKFSRYYNKTNAVNVLTDDMRHQTCHFYKFLIIGYIYYYDTYESIYYDCVIRQHAVELDKNSDEYKLIYDYYMTLV